MELKVKEIPGPGEKSVQEVEKELSSASGGVFGSL